jgi:hypothetical protein
LLLAPTLVSGGGTISSLRLEGDEAGNQAGDSKLSMPPFLAVIWSQEKDSFPFLEGVSVIVISWFTSPLLAGIGGAGLFLFTRHAVLRRQNSYKLSLWMLPLFTFITIYIGCYYIIQKGPKLVRSWENAAGWWAVCPCGAAVVAAGCSCPQRCRLPSRCIAVASS